VLFKISGEENIMTRIQMHYDRVVRPDLISKFVYSNPNQVAGMDHISLHISLKEAIQDPKTLHTAMLALELISGQRGVWVYAKKSVASFQLRKGSPIGCKVTLRKENMYNFLDYLVTVVFPRSRDFKGLSSWSSDGKGNYSFGVTNLLFFPQIEGLYDLFSQLRGMDIHMVTTATTDIEGKFLLTGMRIPFKEN
jgi:large subunit ribosomal protein L5